jgi:hypothetical protein
MGGPRKPKEVTDMKKPKWKVGEHVTFKFIGADREGVILELKKNPYHIDRWIYKIQDTNGYKIPYVGVNDSETTANIYTSDYLAKKSKIDDDDEHLDITKE